MTFCLFFDAVGKTAKLLQFRPKRRGMTCRECVVSLTIFAFICSHFCLHDGDLTGRHVPIERKHLLCTLSCWRILQYVDKNRVQTNRKAKHMKRQILFSNTLSCWPRCSLAADWIRRCRLGSDPGGTWLNKAGQPMWYKRRRWSGSRTPNTPW